MRFLVLVCALLPATALAADRDPAAPAKQCRSLPQLAKAPAPNRPQKLNELPQAEGFYTVQRIEDGCDTPVKVREHRRGKR